MVNFDSGWGFVDELLFKKNSMTVSETTPYIYMNISHKTLSITFKDNCFFKLS